MEEPRVNLKKQTKYERRDVDYKRAIPVKLIQSSF